MAKTKKRAPKLRRFSMSYAYDIPHYADFTVLATDKAHAERIAKRALRAGCFAKVGGEPCHDNAKGDRIFSAGRTHKLDYYPDMLELTGFDLEAYSKRVTVAGRMLQKKAKG